MWQKHCCMAFKAWGQVSAFASWKAGSGESQALSKKSGHLVPPCCEGALAGMWRSGMERCRQPQLFQPSMRAGRQAWVKKLSGTPARSRLQMNSSSSHPPTAALERPRENCPAEISQATELWFTATCYYFKPLSYAARGSRMHVPLIFQIQGLDSK